MLRLLLVLAGAFAIATVVACGDDDGDADGGQSTPTATLDAGDGDRLLALRGYDIAESDYRAYIRGWLLSPLNAAVCDALVGFSLADIVANAGVEIRVADFLDPVAIAVMMGLVIGKPAGILAASFLAVRLGLASLPDGVSWSVLTAAGFLAGIGFTMALFIAGLALDDTVLDAAKVGILAGSALSGAVGVTLLVRLLPKSADAR